MKKVCWIFSRQRDFLKKFSLSESCCHGTVLENALRESDYSESPLRPRLHFAGKVSLWKRINWCFPCTNAGGILKCSNRRSFAICVWGELGQETLIDYRGWQFQMPSVWKAFTKSSVFSRGGLVGTVALTVEIKAPLSNFFVVLCGLSHATHRLVVNSDLFEGRDGGSKVLVLYLGARRLGSSLLAPPTLPGLARSKLLWRKWERPLRIFVK